MGNAESDNSQNNGGNPAWNEFYEAIPEEFRDDIKPHVEPVLQKWDQGVQKQFETYNPYKKYVDDKVDPQVMDYAMNLLDTLNDNDGALQVFNQLGSYLSEQGLIGQEEDQKNAGGSASSTSTDEVDWENLPPALKQEFQKMQETMGMLAQIQIQDKELSKQAQEDKALEAELQSLREKHGDYDEDYVLAKMVNGMEPEKAVEAYFSWLDNTLKTRNAPKPGFKALGAGSGDFPSGSGEFDSRKATGREVQNMIAEKLMNLQRDR